MRPRFLDAALLEVLIRERVTGPSVVAELLRDHEAAFGPLTVPIMVAPGVELLTDAPGEREQRARPIHRQHAR